MSSYLHFLIYQSCAPPVLFTTGWTVYHLCYWRRALTYEQRTNHPGMYLTPKNPLNQPYLASQLHSISKHLANNIIPITQCISYSTLNQASHSKSILSAPTFSPPNRFLIFFTLINYLSHQPINFSHLTNQIDFSHFS